MTFLYVKLRAQTTFENDISSSNLAQRLILLLVVFFMLVKKKSYHGMYGFQNGSF